VVIEAHALGAKVGVDHVDFVAFADRLVRTLRLASAAVYAVLGDVGGHVFSAASHAR
jgi:hypothetical protein